jgi:predicted nucleic acid-binding protein
MSNYVVDASIVVQHFITDTHTRHVDALFDQVGVAITVHVPEFGLLECANVLWKNVRFQGMPQSSAETLVKDLIALDISFEPVVELLPRALEIGVKHQLAIYDSVYIALAEQLGYELITDDEKQAKAASAEGVSLKAITDFKP